MNETYHILMFKNNIKYKIFYNIHENLFEISFYHHISYQKNRKIIYLKILLENYIILKSLVPIVSSYLGDGIVEDIIKLVPPIDENPSRPQSLPGSTISFPRIHLIFFFLSPLFLLPPIILLYDWLFSIFDLGLS